MPRNTLGITVALLAVAVIAGAQPPTAPAPAGRGAPQPQAIQQVKPGLFTAAEGQHFHGGIPAEVPLEGVKHIARTVRSERLDSPVN